MWDTMFPYVAALLPTVAVGALFYFVIKSILEGDRRERLAQSKWEKERQKERGGDTTKNPHNSQERGE
ncbi:MAG: lysyl-tRNA synthetase [Lapillicoccus sp.]